jgi:hypothetical protein
LIDGRTYWFVEGQAAGRRPSSSAYLLPNYDEYLIAYKDRGPVIQTTSAADGVVRLSDAFVHHLVIDGRLAGSWRRTMKEGSVFLEVAPHRRLTRAATLAVAAARERYRRFVDPKPTTS